MYISWMGSNDNLKTPTGRSQPVGYFTCVAEDLNSGRPRTNPASDQGET